MLSILGYIILVSFDHFHYFYVIWVVYEFHDSSWCGEFTLFAALDDEGVLGAVFHSVPKGFAPFGTDET